MVTYVPIRRRTQRRRAKSGAKQGSCARTGTRAHGGMQGCSAEVHACAGWAGQHTVGADMLVRAQREKLESNTHQHTSTPIGRACIAQHTHCLASLLAAPPPLQPQHHTGHPCAHVPGWGPWGACLHTQACHAGSAAISRQVHARQLPWLVPAAPSPLSANSSAASAAMSCRPTPPSTTSRSSAGLLCCFRGWLIHEHAASPQPRSVRHRPDQA